VDVAKQKTEGENKKEVNSKLFSPSVTLR